MSNVNPNSYVTPHAFSNQVSYSNGDSINPEHWYRFNIASIVRGWLNGDYAQSKGVIFKASDAVENGNTNICKTFATYNKPTHKPYLTVTYTMPLAYIVEDSVNVPVGETYFIEASQYQLEHSTNFRWTSSDTSVATVDEYGNITAIAPGTATINMSFTTVSHMEYDSCVVNVSFAEAVSAIGK